MQVESDIDIGFEVLFGAVHRRVARVAVLDGRPATDVGLTAVVAVSVLVLGVAGYRWASGGPHGDSRGDRSTSTGSESGDDRSVSADGNSGDDQSTSTDPGATDGGAGVGQPSGTPSVVADSRAPETGDESTDGVVAGDGPTGAERVTDGAGEKRAAAGGDTRSNGHGVTAGDAGSRSDEERVLALVEDSGGRMRQARIVASTDWSESKVSTLLSEMHDAGSVTKVRLGRENLVCLAGEEPELVGSFAETEEERQV